MPVGVPETEVFAAADRVLARGKRPTVERVRAELGRGSPARVGQLLEAWWDALAQRLAGHASLPGLPEGVASAFVAVWEQAVAAGRAATEQELAAERAALAAVMQAVTKESEQQVAALAQAQAQAAQARAAEEQGLQRLADLHRLLEQQAQELADVRAQRDALQTRAAAYEQDLDALRGERAALQTEAKAERAEWGAQIRALEDRAAREIDRARQDLKSTKAGTAAATKAALRREQALQQALQAAERTVAEQAGRLTALGARATSHQRSASTKPSSSTGRPPKTRAKRTG